MATLIRLIIGTLAILIVWGAGALADHLTSNGQFTIFSVLAFLPIICLWLIVLILSLLPAVAIYAPELKSRIRKGFFHFLAVWNPNKFQILYYVALSYVMTAYLFSVIFKAISNLLIRLHSSRLSRRSLGTARLFQHRYHCNGWLRRYRSRQWLGKIHGLSRNSNGCLAYGVFFFSVIAGFLREGRS